jgi:hypothetical protein
VSRLQRLNDAELQLMKCYLVVSLPIYSSTLSLFLCCMCVCFLICSVVFPSSLSDKHHIYILEVVQTTEFSPDEAEPPYIVVLSFYEASRVNSAPSKYFAAVMDKFESKGEGERA